MVLPSSTIISQVTASAKKMVVGMFGTLGRNKIIVNDDSFKSILNLVKNVSTSRRLKKVTLLDMKTPTKKILRVCRLNQALTGKV